MFFGKPNKAIEYLQSKKPQTSFDYDEIMHETHNKVFTIAKLNDLNLLKDIQNSLIEALKNGDKFETWKKQITPKLKAKGWFGDEVEVINPKTGEVKNIKVGTSRLKKVFETNMRIAKAQAQWENILQSNKEYVRWVSLLHGNRRKEHLALHGMILRVDDPFWINNRPPCGYGCKCSIQGVSESELKLYDWKLSKQTPADLADKNFNYDKNLGVEKLEKLYKEKISQVTQNFIKLEALSLSTKTKENTQSFQREKELYTWQKSLDDMVDEVIVKDNQKYPINFIQVGKMDKSTKEFLEKLNKKDLEDLYFTLSKNNLLHASPKRKASYNQALSADEIKQIVIVLDEAKEVYWDTKEESLVYFFDDLKNSKKVNKIIIRPDYKLKKFGKTNALITLGKVDKDTKESSKEYEKIK
ncbi:phage minor head protein [Campylobacter coli]|uniref:phage head morphogenesis protein n=1 Tax=Campylobacter coli TaxID=195 RepID=UPI00249B87F9|nr:phage minor head protein [Campylobacter coli]WFC17051.1 minor capsid protein [Campylobacter coli]